MVCKGLSLLTDVDQTPESCTPEGKEKDENSFQRTLSIITMLIVSTVFNKP